MYSLVRVGLAQLSFDIFTLFPVIGTVWVGNIQKFHTGRDICEGSVQFPSHTWVQHMKENEAMVRRNWAQVLISCLPFTCCMTLGKFNSFSLFFFFPTASLSINGDYKYAGPSTVTDTRKAPTECCYSLILLRVFQSSLYSLLLNCPVLGRLP